MADRRGGGRKGEHKADIPRPRRLLFGWGGGEGGGGRSFRLETERKKGSIRARPSITSEDERKRAAINFHRIDVPLGKKNVSDNEVDGTLL